SKLLQTGQFGSARGGFGGPAPGPGAGPPMRAKARRKIGGAKRRPLFRARQHTKRPRIVARTLQKKPALAGSQGREGSQLRVGKARSGDTRWSSTSGENRVVVGIEKISNACAGKAKTEDASKKHAPAALGTRRPSTADPALRPRPPHSSSERHFYQPRAP